MVRPTRTRALPGGNIASFQAFLAEVKIRWPFLGNVRGERMARAYGIRLADMLADVTAEADMGTKLGAGLTAIEVSWMRDREWARTAEDCLERRSKLGLTGEVDRARLAALLAEAR